MEGQSWKEGEGKNHMPMHSHTNRQTTASPVYALSKMPDFIPSTSVIDVLSHAHISFRSVSVGVGDAQGFLIVVLPWVSYFLLLRTLQNIKHTIL